MSDDLIETVDELFHELQNGAAFAGDYLLTGESGHTLTEYGMIVERPQPPERYAPADVLRQGAATVAEGYIDSGHGTELHAESRSLRVRTAFEDLAEWLEAKTRVDNSETSLSPQEREDAPPGFLQTYPDRVRQEAFEQAQKLVSACQQVVQPTVRVQRDFSLSEGKP